MKSSGEIGRVLAAIGAVSGTTPMLRRVAALMESGELRFRSIPPEVAGRLHEAAAKGEPAGAATLLEPDGSRTVLWDPRQPLGVSASLVFHELVHCLDKRYWRSIRRARTADERRRGREEAEMRAFRAQARFVRRLGRRFPSHGDFLQAAYPHSRLLTAGFSSREIRELYRRQDALAVA